LPHWLSPERMFVPWEVVTGETASSTPGRQGPWPQVAATHSRPLVRDLGVEDPRHGHPRRRRLGGLCTARGPARPVADHHRGPVRPTRCGPRGNRAAGLRQSGCCAGAVTSTASWRTARRRPYVPWPALRDANSESKTRPRRRTRPRSSRWTCTGGSSTPDGRRRIRRARLAHPTRRSRSSSSSRRTPGSSRA
jgi:hypothetical protein